MAAVLVRAAKPYRKSIMLLLLVTFAASILECIGVALIMPILSVVIEGQVPETIGEALGPLLSRLSPNEILLGLLSGFLIVIVAKNLVVVLRSYLGKRLEWRLRLSWVNQLFECYMYTTYARLQDAKLGELVNDLFTETGRSARCVECIISLATRIMMFVTLVVMLFFIDWRITIAFLTGVAVVGFLAKNISRRMSQVYGTQAVERSQKLTSVATEILGARREVKVLGLEERSRASIGNLVEALRRVQLRFHVYRQLPPQVGEVGVVMILVGGVLVAQMGFSVELKSILPLLAVLYMVSSRLVNSATGIAQLYMQAHNLFPSLSLVQDTIRENSSEDLETGARLKRVCSDIVFDRVSFRYSNGKRVFKDLSLTIPRGRVTAIVGASGVGKSTMMDLLVRLHEPESGKIVVNGRGLCEWNLADWRRRIGVVGQEPIVFNMSLRENISIGRESVSDDEVVSAARRAYAEGFILAFPEGYDTVVGERGAKISGGQRQRIAIARALVRDPDILVLDEATSALDDESERLVQDAIEEVAKTKTVVVVAHRRTTIARADFVFNLDEAAEREAGRSFEEEAPCNPVA